MTFQRPAIGGGGARVGGEPSAALAPGKRTLSEDAAVRGSPPGGATAQRTPDGAAPTRADEVARRGIAGTSAPLPHLGELQRVFGRHDLSGVRAHTDPAAAAAAHALGADAFAFGDDLAFADAPSLHLAAHEAAHAVQQRAGVQLPGGIGAAGDEHERQAAEVADRAVRGESVVPVLGEPVGPGALGGPAGAAPVVQRKITIRDDEPVTYGRPPDKSLDALVARIAQVRSTFRERGPEGRLLLSMWTSGDRSFDSVDALIAELDAHTGGPDGERFFVSNNYKAASPATGAGLGDAERARFAIRCSVAAGEMYREILGGLQPTLSYLEIDGEPHRRSSEVVNYTEWRVGHVEDDDLESAQLSASRCYEDLEANRARAQTQGLATSTLTLDSRYPVLADNKIFASDRPKPIEGLLSAFTMALFLGDHDLSTGNLGLVESPSAFTAVKIDPEAAFGDLFLNQDSGELAQSLRHPEGVPETRGVFTDTFGAEIAGALADREDDDEDDDDDEDGGGGKSDDEDVAIEADTPRCDARVQQLLHSEAANDEMFATITKILDTPLGNFVAVIDRCFKDEFAAHKGSLVQALSERLRRFAEAAQLLPGFTEHRNGTPPLAAMDASPTPFVGPSSSEGRPRGDRDTMSDEVRAIIMGEPLWSSDDDDDGYDSPG